MTTEYGSALPVAFDGNEAYQQASNVIYLDFDGVLNRNSTPLLPVEWCHKMYQHDGSTHTGIDPVLVDRLNAIVDKTGAKVVLTTSWARMYGVVGCRAHLQRVGFRGEVIGQVTYHIGHSHRVASILDDLATRGCSRYVILNDLDDGTDVEHSTDPRIKHHLVLTSPRIGLTENDALVAMCVLSAL